MRCILSDPFVCIIWRRLSCRIFLTFDYHMNAGHTVFLRLRHQHVMSSSAVFVSSSCQIWSYPPCARVVRRNELSAAFTHPILAVPAYVPYYAALQARGAAPRRAAEVQASDWNSGKLVICGRKTPCDVLTSYRRSPSPLRRGMKPRRQPHLHQRRNVDSSGHSDFTRLDLWFYFMRRDL